MKSNYPWSVNDGICNAKGFYYECNPNGYENPTHERLLMALELVIRHEICSRFESFINIILNKNNNKYNLV